MNVNESLSSSTNVTAAFDAAKENFTKTAENQDVNNFSTLYHNALNLLDTVNQSQKTANTAQLDFATGKTDDMLSVMMAQEKAYASLNFTVQMTNKVVEAYKEIMRMQI